MSRKLISGQKPFKILVANLRGSSDPSKGASGNPVKVRSEFTIQHFPEIPGNEQGTENQQGNSPGVHTRVGHVDYTTSPVPVRATGTIAVAATSFAGPTTIRLGEYVLESGVDFDVESGVAYAGEDITDTAPNGALAVFSTAGPNLINVPANIPVEAGSVTLNWTSGAVGRSQVGDGVGGFTGDGNPGGSSINYTTGAITLDTTGLPPDAATTITIDYTAVVDVDAVASRLEAAIDALPGYTASVVGPTVTVTGPAGPTGNRTSFYGGGASPQNFTFSPDRRVLGSGEPSIGPVLIR